MDINKPTQIVISIYANLYTTFWAINYNAIENLEHSDNRWYIVDIINIMHSIKSLSRRSSTQEACPRQMIDTREQD